MKSADQINLNRPEYWNKQVVLSDSTLENAIKLAVKQVEENMHFFGDSFQSAAAVDGIYKKMDNIEWTDGFWTGLLWLAYEITNEDKFKELANKNVDSFKHRIDEKIEVDHHDMGFLYSLSCVAAYKITGNEVAKEAAIQAGEHLLTRFQEKGGFIQAWGTKGEDYRLIIDALLNIPLVYWMSDEEKDKKIYDKAWSHFKATLNTVIRDDFTTYHTYYFDSETGNPLHGKTRQGYSDDSCWARGQAWGVYGVALTQKYNKEVDLSKEFKSLLHVFLNKLPEDDVPYWDLIFTDGSGHSRDSSAASIVVCGILEMIRHMDNEEEKQMYFNIAKKIANSLIKNYANYDVKPGAPLVLHSVYSWHSTRGNKGLDEGNIWGDYFYLEMLYRFKNPDWNEYW